MINKNKSFILEENNLYLKDWRNYIKKLDRDNIKYLIFILVVGMYKKTNRNITKDMGMYLCSEFEKEIYNRSLSYDEYLEIENLDEKIHDIIIDRLNTNNHI